MKKLDNKIFFPQQPIQPITSGRKSLERNGGGNNNSFNDVFSKELTRELKFSNHAQQRLKSRNIEISDAEMRMLNEAVDKARNKGARDSLVLMNDLALVVSVKNNTVITAVDGDSLKDNVFTNIDSAVIL